MNRNSLLGCRNAEFPLLRYLPKDTTILWLQCQGPSECISTPCWKHTMDVPVSCHWKGLYPTMEAAVNLRLPTPQLQNSGHHSHTFPECRPPEPHHHNSKFLGATVSPHRASVTSTKSARNKKLGQPPPSLLTSRPRSCTFPAHRPTSREPK
uniref:Uncharacterized protein n=1 Tax=Pipistrellus kuhlii TaxID=59472 RepID=A0A7J8A7Z6_PIPKU|nr:hypothetical protein mPipKuh1_008916 [Pipistrellus kuhlii]